MNDSTQNWMHGALLAAGLALLAAVIFAGPERGEPVSAGAAGPPGTSPLAPEAGTGPAPPFSMKSRQGKMVKLEDFRGKFVLLNFWATWCKPCKEELPHLALLASRLEDRPVVFVLVSVDDNWDAVEALADELEKSHAVRTDSALMRDTLKMMRGESENAVALLDPAARLPKLYGTEKYPETYLIGPRGDLRAKFTGPKPWGIAPAVAEFTRLVGGD